MGALLGLVLCLGAAQAQSSTAVPIHVPLGAAANYGLLSGDSIQATGLIDVVGRAGGATVATGVSASDTVFTATGGNVPQALTALQAAQAYCAGLTAQPISGTLGGQTLTGGVYHVVGSANCAANATLTLSGDTSSVVVVRVDGNLAFGANSIILLNGLRPENVFWSVGGSIIVASMADVSGILMADASIAVQAVQLGRYGALAGGNVRLTGLTSLLRAAPIFYSHTALAFRQAGSITCSEPAQQACNLVLNGSFGCADDCPAILPTRVVVPNVTYWQGISSPQYFLSCSGGTSYDVPNNQYTLDRSTLPYTPHSVAALTHTPPQYPVTQTSAVGAAYMGIFAAGSTSSGSYLDTRQYLSQRLNDPTIAPNVTLNANKKYYAEFYHYIAPLATHSTQTLSLVVSNGMLPSSGSGIPIGVPTAAIEIQGPASTTVGWHRIGQMFTPGVTFSQPYVTVGDFSTITAGSFAQHNNGPGQSVAMPVSNRLDGRAYYFIDEVLLCAVTEAGPSYTYCGTVPATQLGTCALPRQTGATYLWTTDVPDPTLTASTTANPTVHPAQTTVYTLQVTVNGQSSTTSTTIIVVPVSAGPDQSICAGQNVSLGTASCPINGVTYSWTATPAAQAGLGATNTATTIATPQGQGTYVYTLTIHIPATPSAPATTLTSSATITVQPTAVSTLSTRTVACGGAATLQVACAAFGIQYYWENNAGVPGVAGNSVVVYPSVTTTYTLYAFNSSGQPVGVGLPNTITVTVTPTVVGSPPVQNISCHRTATLQVDCASPGVTYYWQDNTGAQVGIGSSINVQPATNTTYTLTATYDFNGQSVPIGMPNTTTVTVNNGQPCCPGHPYKNSGTYKNPIAGQPDFELGTPNQMTVITAANFSGAPSFNGAYHIVGPILFRQGDFQVKPGTIFYVDGGGFDKSYPSFSPSTQCYKFTVGDIHHFHFLQLYVGDGATLTLTGATLQSACDEMWGGIELVDNGTLRTYRDPVTKKTTTIRDARIGVLAGTDCRSTDARYLLTRTNFINNTYGVVVEGNSMLANPDERRISQCTFFSDPATRLIPDDGLTRGRAANDGDYTEIGLVLRGDWHDEIQYTGNTFNNMNIGAYITGGTDVMRFNNNNFSNNYGISILLGGGVRTKPGFVLIDNNNITVPDAPNPGGQALSGYDVYGIQVAPMPVSAGQLCIAQNTIEGENGAGSGRHKIGLDGEFNFENYYIQQQNQWLGLDEGIRLMDASSNTATNEEVTDNLFDGCTVGTVLTGGRYASFDPVVSCNSFYNYQFALQIASNADVSLLSGPLGGPSGLEPVANRYDGRGIKDVDNGGPNPLQYLAATYTSGSGPSAITVTENPSFTNSGPPAILPTTTGTPCNQRPVFIYGPGVYGLYNRPSAGNTAAADYKNWEEDIAAATQSPQELHQLTLRLIDYREKLKQLDQLETFANTLPTANDAAFERISLYLLEQYRRLGQDSDAQRVRKNLLNERGTDKEIAQRVAYFDVAGHLGSLMPGDRPAPADSAALAGVAASASDFAPVACTTLRYFYPSCTCRRNGGEPGGSAQSRPAASSPTRLPAARHWRPVLVHTYPNPAHEQLTLALDGLAAVRVQLVAAATGQVAVSQAILADRDRAVVSVAGLAPGVYQGQLLNTAGATVGTCKIVVIH